MAFFPDLATIETYNSADKPTEETWKNAFQDYELAKTADKEAELLKIIKHLKDKYTAKQINPDQLFLLALCEENYSSIENALPYLDLAAEQYNREAMYYLGMYYISGKAGMLNPEAAIKLLKLSVDKGHSEALATLDIIQSTTCGLESLVTIFFNDFSKSKKIYLEIIPDFSTLLPLSGKLLFKDFIKISEPYAKNFLSLAMLKLNNIPLILGVFFKRIAKLYSPLLADYGNLSMDEIVKDKSENQKGDILDFLDIFQLKINKELNATTKRSDRIVLQTSIMNFRVQAEMICMQTPKQPSQTKYNQLVGEKLVKLAAKSFKHRHEVLRMLADIVFVPLGIASLGAAFFIKEKISGSKTFFLDSKTERQKKIEAKIEKELGYKKN